MPLPELRPGETRDSFLERCMIDPEMQEFAADGQRYAVCARQYTKGRIARDRAEDQAELGADLTPTEEMAAVARQALKWRETYKRGGTRIGVARARDLANRRTLSKNTIKRMRSYFARHEIDREAEGFREGEPGFPSPGRVAWDLWGGDVAREWVEAILDEEEAEMAPTPSQIAQLSATLAEAPSRRYRMLAYTGQEVDLNGERLVFDLAGVELGSESIPILRQHDPEAIVGHSLDVSIDGEQIIVELQVCPETASGQEVLALFGDGFPWQASVGMVMSEIERFGAGEIVEVNGRTLEGPIGVVRRAILREASFVPLGADAATSVAALAAQLQAEQGEKMTDEEEREVIERKHAEMLDALRDLIDALPDRLEMAVQAYLENKTVMEAKAALADKLLVELAEKNEKLEAAAAPSAELRAEVRREVCAELRQPVDASLDSETGAVELDVRSRWNQAIKAELAGGASRAKAVSNVVRKNPELQAELIASANKNSNS